MGTKTPSKMAVWAIDPMEAQTVPAQDVISELRNWISQANIHVQPVYVLEVGTSLSDISFYVEQRVLDLKTALNKYLNQLDLPNVLGPEVLVSKSNSIMDAIDVLLKFAKQRRSDCIMVSSKGRSGLSRIAFGSFAESLLLKSSIPVWVLSHGDSKSLNSKKFLFATDFSENSKESYREFLRTAQALGAEVVLYYAATIPDTVLAANGMGPIVAIEPYLRDLQEEGEKTAAKWMGEAKRLGVKSQAIVETVIHDVPQAILAAARAKNCGAIAMASQSGPIAAAILGSYARQVVRHSYCPVWVYGPKHTHLYQEVGG